LNKKEANKHFPLWKVEFEEFVYGKDSGNSWDDPENDIRKKGKICYYKKEKLDDDWQLQYQDLFNSFDYAMHLAPITLYKLMECMPPKEDTVMFEWQDKMFKFKYWFDDQKCVYGEAIDEYINEYEDDSGVKADIIHSYIPFYSKDNLVVKSGNLYLNGEKVMSRQLLKDAYGIEKHELEMMYPNAVKEKLKELFPQATSWTSWCGGGVL
jgi:hypothetical protein